MDTFTVPLVLIGVPENIPATLVPRAPRVSAVPSPEIASTFANISSPSPWEYLITVLVVIPVNTPPGDLSVVPELVTIPTVIPLGRANFSKNVVAVKSCA